MPERFRPIDRFILNNWNDEGYEISFYGKKPSVILLGESHTDIVARQKQEELIRLVKPEFVLHEFLSGYIYDPEKDLLTQQPKRRFDPNPKIKKKLDTFTERQTREVLEMAKRVETTFVGCDMTERDFDSGGHHVPRHA